MKGVEVWIITAGSHVVLKSKLKKMTSNSFFCVLDTMTSQEVDYKGIGKHQQKHELSKTFVYQGGIYLNFSDN